MCREANTAQGKGSALTITYSTVNLISTQTDTNAANDVQEQ